MAEVTTPRGRTNTTPQRVETRTITHTYAYLYEAACRALKRVTSDDCYEAMTAMLFASLVPEAYLNHVGAKLFQKSWAVIEPRLSTDAKLDYLRRELKLRIRFGERPFQTLRDMKRFRDSVAHGKTQTTESNYVAELPLEGPMPFELDQIEAQCTADRAKRFVADAKAMVEKLDRATGMNEGEAVWVPSFALSSAETID